MISKEQVQHIAKLARLELKEQEIEKMQKDLSSVLDYFKLLKKAKKPKHRADHNSVIVKDNRVRKDEVMEKDHHIAADLVQAASESKDGYIKVKAIL